jgi:hypothetical protein
MSEQIKTLSWKPRRRGHIYCSPACGGSCKWDDYQLSTKLADQLARRCGVGWKPCVHENLGWHYSAISPCGRLRVYERGEGRSRYQAWLQSREQLGGQWIEDARTPAAAIARAIASCKADLNKLTHFLKGL